MLFYAFQVRTGMENRFLSIARKRGTGVSEALIWPRRRLRVKQGGVWRDSLAPLFPGYLFVRMDRLDDAAAGVLRAFPGFIRFLPSNHRRAPLDRRDQATLTHFLSFGEVVDTSRVTFDENRRIRVVSGPLQGLEGRIVKVDRRKGRAKVRLDLYTETFEIDFGFETIEASPGTVERGSP
jgi:transcription termination/antitermination protein NusG